MSGIGFGEVTAAPDGDGFGQVRIGGVARRCYFAPERFAAPWPVPEVDQRVAVAPGTPQYHALWLIGQGAATYEYAG